MVTRQSLRPASWNLSASDLPTRRADWREWTQAWSGQRRRYHIPDVVHLGEQDVRIRLDLNEPAHLAMLRTHLNRAGNATLTEAPDAHDYGWNGGHAHEVVIPLAAARPPSARQVGPIRATSHSGHTPGNSLWLYARLYGHPDRQTAILTTYLPELLSAWEDDQPPNWWFLRYPEPEPHLRLRIRLHNARSYGAATQRLGDWADRVRRLGLLRNIVLDTYYPEVGRYGTGAAMHAAEAVFAADSAVAIAALTVTASGTPLVAYRTHLRPAQGPDPDAVLASLLHLHHARMVGINQDSERICFRLARAAALGWVARHERSGPSPSTSAMLTPPLP